MLFDNDVCKLSLRDLEFLGKSYNLTTYGDKQSLCDKLKGLDADYRIFETSVRNGYFNIIKYLTDKGADIHANNDYSLRLSSQLGHKDIVKFLVENGADIHADNDSSLRLSSQYGYFEIVRYLVKKGASVSFILHQNQLKPPIYQFLQKLQRKSKLQKVLTLVKNKDIYYKWQAMCRDSHSTDLTDLNKLQTLAKLHNVPNTGSKREICKQLAELYTNNLNSSQNCHNETSILGDPVSLIPKPLLIEILENGKNYCFNIIELVEQIRLGDKLNPYTRQKLPLNEITSKFQHLQKILLQDKLALTNILDEIQNNQIMTTESIFLLKVTNLLSLLNYTPNIKHVIEMSDEQVTDLFELIKSNSLFDVRGTENKEHLVDEMLRVLNIDDVNKQTRRIAFEVYLNEIIH